MHCCSSHNAHGFSRIPGKIGSLEELLHSRTKLVHIFGTTNSLREPGQDIQGRVGYGLGKGKEVIYDLAEVSQPRTAFRILRPGDFIKEPLQITLGRKLEEDPVNQVLENFVENFGILPTGAPWVADVLAVKGFQSADFTRVNGRLMVSPVLARLPRPGEDDRLC